MKHLYYIQGLQGLAGIYVKQSGQTSDKLYYADVDHQGSILRLTDNANKEVFAATYDAWGNRTVTNNTFDFHRGYTGHEHLPEFGLINMNGRMYDSALGRMLSPDNYVQSPLFSQSYNRYSYCVNNPLKFTDPKGEKRQNLYYSMEAGGGWAGYIDDNPVDYDQHLRKSGESGFDDSDDPGYKYNWSTGQYVDKYGNVVSFDVVYSWWKATGSLIPLTWYNYMDFAIHYGWDAQTISTLKNLGVDAGFSMGKTIAGVIKITSKTVLVGYFNGIPVFESSIFGGIRFDALGQPHVVSGGLTIPGVGIFVGKDVLSYAEIDKYAMATLQHEYGHVLDSENFSEIGYYLGIGLPSIISAGISTLFKLNHDNFFTERRANDWAKNYFGPEYVPFPKNPQ